MSSPLTNICLWRRRRRRRGVVSQSNFHPCRSPTHARTASPWPRSCPHSHSFAPLVQRAPHGDDALHRSIVRSLSRSARSVQSHRSQSVTHPGRIPSVRGIGGNCFALGGKWASSAAVSPQFLPPSPLLCLHPEMASLECDIVQIICHLPAPLSLSPLPPPSWPCGRVSAWNATISSPTTSSE